MSYSPDNTFAKILCGELPCIKVYEDAHTLAFMDIMPQADGHTLVIPKEAALTLFELSDEAATACMRTTQKVARAVKQAMHVPAVLILQANGPEAGQTVGHVHFHIIPRSSGRALKMHAAIKEEREKLEGFARRIVAALEP